MTSDKTLLVRAFWDDKAQVWVGSSDDVPGLATEADTVDALVKKLQTMIPELLDANGYVGADEVSFKLLSEINAVAYRPAAQ